MVTWDNILNSSDLVGSDLETTEDSTRYRGPISKIALEGNMIVFYVDWIAKKIGDRWIIREDSGQVAVNIRYTNPITNSDGNIEFDLPYLGWAVIHPKGDSLNRANVNFA